MASATLYASLGSNLGDRRQNLYNALQSLARQGIFVIAASSLYETEPQDVTDQPWFLNMAVACRTQLSPPEVLARFQQIERDLGRVRIGAPPRGPRLIDLDILLFGEMKSESPELTLPHPRMLQRRFVLEPLLEIAPEITHPATGEPLSKRLDKLKGQSVKRLGPLAVCPDIGN
jgi:2-amino-4-hydroxy-6-hydroxymethyldihydropteridine diphosphokinase